MARIALVPHPHMSGIIAVMGLGTQLMRLGHEVLLVGNKRVVDAAEERGFKTAQLLGSKVKGPIPHNGSVPTRWRNYKARMAYSLAKLGADSVEELFAELRPDLVLVDQEMAHVAIPLLGMGINTGVSSNLMSLVEQPGVPPPSEYCVPGQGARGSRLGIRWIWWRYRFRKWLAQTRNWIASGRVNRATTLKALARLYGIDPSMHLRFYEWLIPANLVSLPLLYTTPEALELPYDLPPDTTYLGARVDESRRHAVSDLPPQLARVLDRRDTDRQLVYCAFGAFFDGDDSTFLRLAIQALNRLDNVDVVVGLGGRGEVETLGPLAPHVVVFPWAPQINVLDVADAALIHAGGGTICECAYFGVPFVTYPFDVNEQQGNASRAVYHQIGVLGDRDQDGVTEILSKLQTVLSDPTIRSNAKSMKERYRRSMADGRLSAVIDELVERGAAR
ncbi:MAG: nucleotide disphospho-sugar-binding domain-containing protein [Bacteroidota bacterium]